jgi:iron complex outermembrane receptor protein
LLTYINYGTAWRPGNGIVGIQNLGSPPKADLAALARTQPENSRGWELGAKAAFLDHRAQMDVAFFYQKYDGYIYFTPLVAYISNAGFGDAPSVYQFSTNVPATVKGVDLSTKFQLAERWSAGLAASYADGKMNNGTVPCGTDSAAIPSGAGVALCNSNAAISTAPKWNANLTSEYALPVTSSMDTYVRGLFTYYPSNSRANGDGAGFTAPAYGILNLYVGLRSADSGWDIQLFARNLTDTNKTLTYAPQMEKSSDASIAASFGKTGYYATSVTPEREIGLSARYAFGSR